MAKRTLPGAALAARNPVGTRTKAVAAGASRKPAGVSPDKSKAYRAGKVNITGYFAPAVKQLRLIQAKHRPESNLQDLLAEALDDLFAKYNVPKPRVRRSRLQSLAVNS
jgi:hypothetical protein